MKKTLIALVLLCASFSALAFSTAELAALKSAVLAEPSIQSCVTAGDDGCVATWLNSPSSFYVWKTSVSDRDIYKSPGFNFTLVDGLTQGKRDEWTDFLFKQGSINPSSQNIRDGIADIWVGTAAKLAVQAAIFDVCKRFSTNAEKALATGTGTSAVPGLLTWEGQVVVSDVVQIMGRQ